MIKQLAVGAVLVLLAGCAAPSQRAAAVPHEADDGATQCHTVTTAGHSQVYCGTPDQWQDLQRRVAQINDAVQCRVTKVLGRQCLTAQQWQQLQRTLTGRNQAMNMGALMSDAAATLALSRQNTMTATFPQQPAPAPVAAPVPVK